MKGKLSSRVLLVSLGVTVCLWPPAAALLLAARI